MGFFNETIETATKPELEKYQFSRFKDLLRMVAERNRFYRTKYEKAKIDISAIRTMDDINQLPFTDKKDFENDQLSSPLYGTTLTEPLENYVQYHQTTGTTGKPLKMLDTKESWEWRARCACYILAAAGVTRKDTVLMAFNFGPYTAFWVLYEGAYRTGCLVIPTGGWTTEQRLSCIYENQVSVVVGTPTYILRLAAVAREQGLDPRGSGVHTLILSGERGATDPFLRTKICGAWDANCFDYVGLTEVGTWGFQCDQSESAIHINEAEFIAEVIDPQSGKNIPPGEEGELVLTNLGRSCNPAIRFRTHDMVKVQQGRCPCGRVFRLLDGGILGRQDEMVKIRGINIFPSSIGLVIERHLDPGDEYQVVAYREEDRDQIEIAIEKEASEEDLHLFRNRLQAELKNEFNLTLNIRTVRRHTLPRYEYKAKRFVDRRQK
jgi:phenylacetate-CoA ligase